MQLIYVEVQMLKISINKCGAALAVALTLSVIAPAQAIVVGGRWDPKYGLPFEGSDPAVNTDDMFWSGVALFHIPDACAAAGLVTSATCAGMYVSNASVYLSVGQNGALVDTLEFDGQLALNKVQFAADGKTVMWVESDWWNPLEAGSASQYDLSNYLFSLNFSEGGSNLFHTGKTAFLDSHGGHGPKDKDYYFWNGKGDGHIGDLCAPTTAPGDGIHCGFSDTLGRMEFFSVPEPSTYALLFASVGAFGFTALRRRDKQSAAT